MSSSWDSVQNRKEGWKTNKRKRTFPLQLTTTGSSSSTPSSSSSSTSSGWMTTKNSQGKTKPNKFVNEASSWSKQTFKKALLKTTSASQTVDPKTMVYDATTNQTVMEALTSLFPYIQDDDISVGSSSSIDTSSSSSKQKANFITRLNPQQLNIVTSVVAGLSTFYTGPAGTGKSHVLSAILRSIEMLNPPANRKQRKSIVLTATTGIAACNIGGVTLHSFAGVGTGAETADKLLGKVSGNEFSKKRWREVDILVIDEVSMMEAVFLDKLEFVARRVRNDNRPFGGIQLVLTGDFFQLPPVNLKSGFAFQATCWPDIACRSVVLTEIYRQSGDPRLMEILEEARVGNLSSKSVALLRKHEIDGRKKSYSSSGSSSRNNSNSDIIPTRLECKNVNVDAENEKHLSLLEGEVTTYESVDWAVSTTAEAMLKHVRAPTHLELKQYAQVILLKNVCPEKGLVNGARGVVVGFQRPGGDVPKEWRDQDLPVVEVVVEPAEWSNKSSNDAIICSRWQIPLRLAWSLSVHKSQGMTIPNLEINLKGVFEFGQAYVALSRGVSLDKLKLKDFSEKAFRAHPRVKEFYEVMNEIQGGGGDDEEEAQIRKSPKPTPSASPKPTPNLKTKPQAKQAQKPKQTINSSKQLSKEQKKKIELNRLKAQKIREEMIKKNAAAGQD